MPRRPQKAQDIATWLEGRLDAGDFTGQEWLPPWDVLAADFPRDLDENPPARGTVRAALQLLVQRGRIQVVAGRGAKLLPPTPVTRTSADQLRMAGDWRGWHVVCEEQGKKPFTDPHRGWVTLGPVPAHWLGLPVGDPAYERWRTQGWYEGKRKLPVVLSWTYIRPDVVAQIPKLAEKSTGKGGMTSRFEEAGYVVWWEEQVDARPSTPEEAARLEMSADAPVLDVWRRCYDQNSRILEVTRRVINPVLHQLVYRYP